MSNQTKGKSCPSCGNGSVPCVICEDVGAVSTAHVVPLESREDVLPLELTPGDNLAQYG